MPEPRAVSATSSGVELLVRVVPRAAKTEAAGTRAGAVLIRLAAPPVDGAANAALVAFLSEILAVPRRAITILSGEKSRLKRITIEGVTVARVSDALALP